MFESVTSLIGLPGAVLAVWVVLIGALFLVTRGLSRSLAWAFVAGGLVIPAAVLQVWPLTPADACVETVLSEGDSRDGRYAYRIVKSRCGTSSELAYRVDMGRTGEDTPEATLRPVMRSYGFPRPVAVSQIADNHFLIFLTSDGRDQVPLRISLDPETGEPSYVHRFFQGHSDRSFTVSGLTETAHKEPAGHKSGKCPKQDKASSGHELDATVTVRRPAGGEDAAGKNGRLNFRLSLRGLLPSR